MQFHTDKCEVIHITNKMNHISGKYSIHGQQLQIVKHAKYLGVTISSGLSWNQHIDNTVKKATNSFNFLRRNIRDCSPMVKEQCYKLIAGTTGHGVCFLCWGSLYKHKHLIQRKTFTDSLFITAQIIQWNYCYCRYSSKASKFTHSTSSCPKLNIAETSPYSFGNFRKLSLYNFFMPI